MPHFWKTLPPGWYAWDKWYQDSDEGGGDGGGGDGGDSGDSDGDSGGDGGGDGGDGGGDGGDGGGGGGDSGGDGGGGGGDENNGDGGGGGFDNGGNDFSGSYDSGFDSGMDSGSYNEPRHRDSSSSFKLRFDGSEDGGRDSGDEDGDGIPNTLADRAERDYRERQQQIEDERRQKELADAAVQAATDETLMKGEAAAPDVTAPTPPDTQIRIRRNAPSAGGGTVGYETTVTQRDLDAMTPEERAHWDLVSAPTPKPAESAPTAAPAAAPAPPSTAHGTTVTGERVVSTSTANLTPEQRIEYENAVDAAIKAKKPIPPPPGEQPTAPSAPATEPATEPATAPTQAATGAAETTVRAGGTQSDAEVAAAVAAELASHPQTLSQQSGWTQQTFRSTYGAGADQEWQRQHAADLARNYRLYGKAEPQAGAPGMPGTNAPVAPNRRIGSTGPPGPGQRAAHGINWTDETQAVAPSTTTPGKVEVGAPSVLPGTVYANQNAGGGPGEPPARGGERLPAQPVVPAPVYRPQPPTNVQPAPAQPVAPAPAGTPPEEGTRGTPAPPPPAEAPGISPAEEPRSQDRYPAPTGATPTYEFPEPNAGTGLPEEQRTPPATAPVPAPAPPVDLFPPAIPQPEKPSWLDGAFSNPVAPFPPEVGPVQGPPVYTDPRYRQTDPSTWRFAPGGPPPPGTNWWNMPAENTAPEANLPVGDAGVTALSANEDLARAPLEAPPPPVTSSVQVVPGSPNSYWTSGGTHGGWPAADIFADKGSPILAPVGGVSAPAVYQLGGNTTTIKGDDGRYYYLAHGNVPFVGGRVEAGQQIGEVGQTGNAQGTAPHLHLAIATKPEVFSQHNGSGDLEGDDSYWKPPTNTTVAAAPNQPTPMAATQPTSPASTQTTVQPAAPGPLPSSPVENAPYTVDQALQNLDTTTPLDTIVSLAGLARGHSPEETATMSTQLQQGMTQLANGDPAGKWTEPYLNDVARLAWAREERTNGRVSDPRLAPVDYIEKWKDAYFGKDSSVALVGELHRQLDRAPGANGTASRANLTPTPVMQKVAPAGSSNTTTNLSASNQSSEPDPMTATGGPIADPHVQSRTAGASTLPWYKDVDPDAGEYTGESSVDSVAARIWRNAYEMSGGDTLFATLMGGLTNGEGGYGGRQDAAGASGIFQFDPRFGEGKGFAAWLKQNGYDIDPQRAVRNVDLTMAYYAPFIKEAYDNAKARGVTDEQALLKAMVTEPSSRGYGHNSRAYSAGYADRYINGLAEYKRGIFRGR